ncbi:lipopolysaccharide biosynthesis protein [Priestia aryabhattai]|uniref:lipopolysaccharide biosynthesis protein n=1 Tax=Priestia aryabhattai TaxID=412384 RepID=UPI002E1C5A84|nr:lipopolysaccharide biosynthesis protein [Priestia aryabhattai]
MERKSLKARIFGGVFWKFTEKTISQGMSFLISIILARILLPEEYGIVAIVLVFITMANVFVTNGFGESLVQKKDADETDFSTIFYCSLILSMVLYLLIFISAPAIAAFYKNEQLTGVLRVLAILLPVGSINTIQQAYISKHMVFRKSFFSTLIGTLLSGGMGIWMAYQGFGIWSLVGQYLLYSIVETTVLFFIVDWRPKFKFSVNSAKALIGFGWKLTAAQLINTGYAQLRTLLIGKVYSATDLAYYNRGNQFPQLFITNVDSSISSVLFPAMSNCNSDVSEVKRLTRKSMRITAYVIFPLMAGLAAVAEPLVSLLLTDKWLFCVPFLKWGCLYFAMQPIQTANWQAIKALGRSDICFKYEVIKKLLGILLLIFTLKISVYAVAVTNGIMGILMALINMYPNQKLINYRYVEQFKDLLPSLLAAGLMGICVSFLKFTSISSGLLLIMQTVTGIVSYIFLSRILKIEEYQILRKLLLKLLGTKRNKKEKTKSVIG